MVAHLGFVWVDAAEVAHVTLVAHDRHDRVGLCMVPQLLQPALAVLKRDYTTLHTVTLEHHQQGDCRAGHVQLSIAAAQWSLHGSNQDTKESTGAAAGPRGSAVQVHSHSWHTATC